MKAGKIRQFILTTAGILAVVTTAGAQGFGGPGAGPGRMMNRPPMERAFGAMQEGNRSWWNNPSTVDRLKLTDDQRKSMDGIQLQHREKLIDLRADLEKAELALQPLMGADTPNDSAITAQIDKVVQARAELERANARYLLAIRDKLTADQWKQIKENQQARGAERWRGGGPGMQRPGMQRPGFRRQGPPPGQQQAPPPPANAPGAGAAPGPGAEMEQ